MEYSNVYIICALSRANENLIKQTLRIISLSFRIVLLSLLPYSLQRSSLPFHWLQFRYTCGQSIHIALLFPQYFSYGRMYSDSVLKVGIFSYNWCFVYYLAYWIKSYSWSVMFEELQSANDVEREHIAFHLGVVCSLHSSHNIHINCRWMNKSH